MADLRPRCRRPTWGAVSTLPRPFRDLPTALLHLRDLRGHRTILAIRQDKQDTGRPGTRATAHTTPGTAWDIGDPISMGPTQGISPSAMVFRSDSRTGTTRMRAARKWRRLSLTIVTRPRR